MAMAQTGVPQNTLLVKGTNLTQNIVQFGYDFVLYVYVRHHAILTWGWIEHDWCGPCSCVVVTAKQTEEL